MSVADLDLEVTAFFERYNAAFDTMDGGRIADLYHTPTVTMRGDGSIHCLQSRADIARFFQVVVETYRKEGYRSGVFKNLAVTPIGELSALATMDWELHRADATVIRKWCQSYNIVRVEDGWKILVATFHVPHANAVA